MMKSPKATFLIISNDEKKQVFPNPQPWISSSSCAATGSWRKRNTSTALESTQHNEVVTKSEPLLDVIENEPNLAPLSSVPGFRNSPVFPLCAMCPHPATNSTEKRKVVVSTGEEMRSYSVVSLPTAEEMRSYYLAAKKVAKKLGDRSWACTKGTLINKDASAESCWICREAETQDWTLLVALVRSCCTTDLVCSIITVVRSWCLSLTSAISPQHQDDYCRDDAVMVDVAVDTTNCPVWLLFDLAGYNQHTNWHQLFKRAISAVIVKGGVNMGPQEPIQSLIPVENEPCQMNTKSSFAPLVTATGTFLLKS